VRYDTDHVRFWTERVRAEATDLDASIARALRGRGIDPATTVVADVTPMSRFLASGAESERHHVIVVTGDRQAFVTHHERTVDDETFLHWQEVVTAPIPDLDELLAELRTRLYRPPVRPDSDLTVEDVIYHRSVLAGLAVLDEEGRANA
jgi:hypothetical protein